MTTAVIACKTIEDELEAAMSRMGVEYPIYWLESGLHDIPKRLLCSVAEKLKLAPEERILLAMGHCGNSLVGLNTLDHEVILPAADDCITLLLGSCRRRVQVARDYAAYFLTEGWMRGERNLWVEYQHTLNKYGYETAQSIAEMMYGHYKTLALLDSGVTPIESLIDETRIIASTLKMEQRVIPATLGYLQDLLTGPWESDRFHCFSPGHTIVSDELLISSVKIGN